MRQGGSQSPGALPSFNQTSPPHAVPQGPLSFSTGSEFIQFQTPHIGHGQVFEGVFDPRSFSQSAPGLADSTSDGQPTDFDQNAYTHPFQASTV